MFTQTMNSDELICEFNADNEELDKYIDRIDSSSSTDRILAKGRSRKQVSFYREHTTSRNNRYVNVFVYTRSGSNKQRTWDMKCYSIGIMNTYEGQQALSCFIGHNMAMSYKPHFFNRYCERMREVCDWKVDNELSKARSISDLIHVFFKRNTHFQICRNISRYGDKEHLFITTNDGIILAQFNGQNYQANTFITYDMCSQNQNKILEYLNECFEKRVAMQEIVSALFQINNLRENDEI